MTIWWMMTTSATISVHDTMLNKVPRVANKRCEKALKGSRFQSPKPRSISGRANHRKIGGQRQKPNLDLSATLTQPHSVR